MKIYLDTIIFSLQRAGGISVYFYELAARLLSGGYDAGFIQPSGSGRNLFRRRLPIPSDRILPDRTPLALARFWPRRVPGHQPALIHSSYYRVYPQPGVANIVTVYDFGYELFRSGPPRWVHGWQKRRAVSLADGVICISESTRADLVRLYPEVDPGKVRAIHLAAGDEFRPLGPDGPGQAADQRIREATAGPYILYVGERVHHKNFSAAVETLERLPEYSLVLAGGRPLSPEEKRRLDRGLGGRYCHLGAVDARTLNLLYNRAACLLYPSLYEGFGVPLLEAMKAGCPVVAARRGSVPEVCGEAGCLTDAPAARDFAGQVRRLQDAGERRRMIEAGLVQARRFSWDGTFAQTVDFYHQVYQRRFHPDRSSGGQRTGDGL